MISFRILCAKQLLIAIFYVIIHALGSSRAKPKESANHGTDTNHGAVQAGGAVAGENSPKWLDSSYPPAYAKEIRKLYKKQKKETPGKKGR